MLACLERGDTWLRLPSEYLAQKSHKVDAAAGVKIAPRLVRERDGRRSFTGIDHREEALLRGRIQKVVLDHKYHVEYNTFKTEQHLRNVGEVGPIQRGRAVGDDS